MKLSVVGIDHAAPVRVREQFSLNRPQTLRLLGDIRQESILGEAMILSTCNRTEIYGLAQDDWDLPHLMSHLAQVKGAAPFADLSALFRYEGADAVKHLFRVAGALDSQVVGEHEIIGQVKDAYRLALEACTAGFMVNKLMHRAFRVGSRVMAETRLGQGTTSIAQAAVDMARQIYTNLAGKCVLLVGAGQTAELAAMNLLKAGASRLIVANRTLANAQELIETLRRRQVAGPGEGLADMDSERTTCPAMKYMIHCSTQRRADLLRGVKLNAQAIELGEIPGLIDQADLVISSTGATEPVLTYESLRDRLAHARHSVLMIDIAVPRDIDPRLAGVANVFLYNIDDLQGVVDENIRRRAEEIPRAEAIVEYELDEFVRWSGTLSAVPTIKLLQQRVDELLESELDRYRTQFSPHEREQIKKFTRSLCNKLLHPPISFLREVNPDKSAGADLAAVDLFRRIFKLDDPSDER